MEIIDVQMPVGIGVDVDVLENLKKAKLTRAQEKTKTELQLINERVKHIFEDYEFDEQMSLHAAASNIEFMADIAELQSVLTDDLEKNKYHQKVTIFIVGFQDVCTKRMQILNQLSEFFEMYAVPDEGEDFGQDSLAGIDIETINDNIQTALDTMDTAVSRLNELNQDIIGHMSSMHSALTGKTMKNRKKLEKNFALAKEDLVKVTENLQIAQQEVKAKEEQLQKASKQMDNKSKELLNFKIQLEKSRKNLDLVQKEMNQTRFSFEDEIRRAENWIAKLEQELQELRKENAMSYKVKIQEIIDASLAELASIKDNFSDTEEKQNEFRKEIALQYRVQTRQIEYIQSEELSSIQYEYRKQLSQMLEIEVSEEDIQQWGKEDEEEVEEEPSQQVESPDHAENESPGDEEELVAPPSPLSERESPIISPEQLISRSTIEPMRQPVDLTDVEFWENVSEHELPTRFAEFREEAMKQINELQSMATQTTVNEEKAQRQREEKKRWREEKEKLMDHIQQLQKLQEEAEADADEAMRQLEELASQQREESQPTEASEILDDAARQVTSSEGMRDENVKSREQGTSPDMQKSLSSISKKSVVSLVEEKRAAMLRRKESASRLLNSSSGNKRTTPSIQVTNDTEAFENFVKSYQTTLEFRKRVGNILSRHSAGESFSKTLSSSPGRDLVPDEYETEEMVYSVENTLNAVETALKSFVGSMPRKNMKSSPRQPTPVNIDDGAENEELRNRISELESEIVMMKGEYGRRADHDLLLIQHLQNTVSNIKHDNIPSNMQMTTNTPSASAPVPSEPLLTASHGNRGHTVDATMTMMFTRLDSEHNTKTLIKSTKNGKIHQSTLDSLVATMEGYNEIAASRLRQLVQKIVHHTNMKEIEMNVRHSNLVTSEVFDILEKMEELQRRRAQNWSKQMDDLSARRNRLGMLLQDAMSRLERITGVFLIKPLISYKGKTRLRKYSGKISTRFNKFQIEAMVAKEQSKRLLENEYLKTRTSRRTFNLLPSRGSVPWTAETGGKEVVKESLTVSGLNRAEQPTMWSLDASHAQSVPLTKKEKWSPIYSSLPATVPKIVELDVGRYLHEINTIHAYTTPTSQLKSPRIMLGAIKTYTGISRTGGTAGNEISKLSSERRSQTRDKTHAANTIQTESSSDDYQSTAPPTTPASQVQTRRGSSGVGLITPNSEGHSLSRPLPPIQVPSRSRASTRSSFSGSPSKEYSTPSPSKEHPSPFARSKSEGLLAGADGDGLPDESSTTSPLQQQYVEIAN